MAVLPDVAAEFALDVQNQRSADARWLRTLTRLLTEDLPDDVQSAEVSVAVLFRASQILNFLTGSAPEMTFSARCHRAQRISRGIIARLGWSVMVVLIDTVCGALRGEHKHCATAWTNYALRPGRARRIRPPA